MSTWFDKAGDFGAGVARGARRAAGNTWDDLKALGQGAIDIARDPAAREQFWQATRAKAQAVAAYGAQAYENPRMVWDDARATAGRAYTAGKQFVTQADAGQWGDALGDGLVQVGTSVVGGGVVAKGGQAIARGGRLGARARQLARGEEALPDVPPRAIVPCPKAIAETKRRERLRADLGPEHFDDAGQLRWPPNNGFAEPPVLTTLRPGTVIDRYSPRVGEADRGSFFAPAGTPYGARALPYDPAQMQHATYRVLKPLDSLGGRAAAAFGEPGGGLQYKTPLSTAELIRQGYLQQLTP